MGKITLLVRTIIYLFLFIGSTNYIFGINSTGLGSDFSKSEEVCYMFFESKEIETLDFKNSIIGALTESPYKTEKFSSSFVYAKPTVNIGSNPTVSVCQGVNTANLAYTNATQSANKFTVTYDASAKAQGFTDILKKTFPGGASGNFPLTFPSNPLPGTYNANLKVHNTNATENESENYPFKIIIKAIPTVNQTNDQTVCNNLNTTAINFSGNNISGVVYNWTNNTPSIGLDGSGSGNISSFKALNTTNSRVTATITVTPTANGCTGTPKTFKINVDPTTSFNKPADITVCDGVNTSAITFTGASVTGTTYAWTNNNTAIGLAASGNGNISTFNATNTTSAPIDATITVTPIANGCEGTPQSFTITVNPTTTFTKPTDVVACNSETISAINFTGASVSGTTYAWTNDNAAIGLAASGNGNISTFNASNTTNAPISATITVTPTANNCEGTPQSFNITVNPTTTFTKPTDVVACNSDSISAINFTGASVSGTTYAWINDNTAIGLAASGNGNISTFNATNTTNAPINATITVTPTANNCEGTPQSFNITINPTTTFTKPTDVVACNSESISAINFTGASVSGTTYAWTNDNTVIGLAASGNGNISTFNATNTTDTPISATITVTPTANGCTGTQQTFTITVNPTATFTQPSNIIACNEDIISEIVFEGNTVTNTTYNWTNNNTAIGLPASGTGNIASFTATNNGTAPIVAEITVTPIANNCEGTPQTFTINVNPTIVIEFELIPVTCNGEKNGEINITSATGGNGVLRYSLDNVNFDTEKTIDNLYAGIYTLYVKDAEVCTYEIDFEIAEPTELAITDPSSTDETCFSGIDGVHDGTITAGTVTGGNGEYLYSLDNSTFQSSPFFDGLAADNYTIFIKDKEGCATQSNITVGSLAEMKASLTKTDINCFGESTGTIKVNNPTGGSGSYEYQIIDINNPTGTEAWISNPEFSNLASSDYKINIRDVSNPNCIVEISNSFTLSQPTAALSATTTATRTQNYGSPTGSATATAAGGSGGYTYEWRVLGQLDVIQTTKTANSLSAGDYEVTVFDSNGCSTIQTATVVDVVLASISDTSRCLQNTDNIRTSSFQIDPDLTVGGIGNPYNFKYEWNFGAQAVPATAEGLDRFVVEYRTKGDKIITLTVTDEAGVVSTQTLDHYVGGCFEGCRSANSSQDFVIDEENYFIGDVNGNRITNDNCDTTGEKYLWIDIIKSSNVYVLDVELIYNTTKTNTLTGLVTSDSGQLTGCFGTKDPNSNKDEWEIIPVGLYPLFKVDSAESNTDIEWECGEGFSISQIRIRWTTNSRKECGDATGNSCIDSSDIVPVSVPIFANIDFTDTPCNGTALGSVIIRANGGVKPFAYSMNGNVQSEYVDAKEFYNLAAGVYNDFWVKDSKGTTYQVPSVTISEPAVLALTVEEDNPIICFGDLTSATANVTGGTQPYTYLWNDDAGHITQTAEDLPAGTYTVTVSDANECQEIATITISQPVELTAPIAGDDQSFKCGVISTSLNANTPEEGVGKWVITSGTGGSFSDETDPLTTFTGTANTTYLLEWTIGNSDGTCLKTDELSITFLEDCSALDFDGIDDHVIFDNNYNLPSGNFTFETWVKINTTDGMRTVFSKRDASNLGSGGYDLIINNGAPTFRWGNISVSTSSKLTTSRWYHLAVSYDGAKYFLYVDGIDVGTKTGVNPVSIDSPFIVGAMYNKSSPEVPSNYFDGWIEELRIWNIALNESQIHFMMNQRLEIGTSPIKGSILPLEVPGSLSWNNLNGYYQLISANVTNGITLDEASNKIDGILKNIETNQENTAPLPYLSNANGVWSDTNTWLRPDVWDYPNAKGINGERIEWNIAETSHNITSGGQDISLLGLFSESNEIKMFNPNEDEDETNSGQGLTITHYLSLDGSIDLIGDSQLVQTEGSILDNASTGFIEKDQQGTASSYNYNYWSSPVVPQANALNSTYTVADVLMDGTNSNSPRNIDFGQGVTYADGAAGNPRKISNYWIYKFRGKADAEGAFEHVGSTKSLTVGEGYTMKGTSGTAAISDRQNYVFKGKPNNGDITLNVSKDQNYLLGNPYPSALDANKFILDNLNASGGTNSNNIFNGALYFWDHFSGKTHTFREYVGGYATYNLIGGVKAIATDDRINSNTGEETSNDNVPGQYIPVGQGFFINTVLDDDVSGNYTVDGGNVLFKNSQRAFVRENTAESHFLSQEKNTKNNKEAEADPKIRLDFSSPLGYHRQILVGANPNATNGFDLGYDAPLNDYNLEDFFWLINNREYVIQGVENFAVEQVLPIGIYISQKGEFTIKINKLENVPEETNIYLKDILENKYYDLRKAEFKLDIEPGAYYERFEIVFFKPEDATSETEEETTEETEAEEETNEETDSDTSEEEEEEEEEVIIVTPEIPIDAEIEMYYMGNDRELSILNPALLPIQKIEIYNLLGQKVQQYLEVSNLKEVRLPVYQNATGIYIVKLYSENSLLSKNIMIK